MLYDILIRMAPPETPPQMPEAEEDDFDRFYIIPDVDDKTEGEGTVSDDRTSVGELDLTDPDENGIEDGDEEDFDDNEVEFEFDANEGDIPTDPEEFQQYIDRVKQENKAVASAPVEKYPRKVTGELFNPKDLSEEQKNAVIARWGELYKEARREGSWKELLEYWNKLNDTGMRRKLSPEDRGKMEGHLNEYIQSAWQKAQQDTTGEEKMRVAQTLNFARRLGFNTYEELTNPQREMLGEWRQTMENKGDAYLRYLINLKGLDAKYVAESQDGLNRWYTASMNEEPLNVHAATLRAARLSRLVDPQSDLYTEVQAYQQKVHAEAKDVMQTSGRWATNDVKMKAIDHKYNAGNDKLPLRDAEVDFSIAWRLGEEDPNQLIERGYWSVQVERYTPPGRSELLVAHRPKSSTLKDGQTLNQETDSLDKFVGPIPDADRQQAETIMKQWEDHVLPQYIQAMEAANTVRGPYERLLRQYIQTDMDRDIWERDTIVPVGYTDQELQTKYRLRELAVLTADNAARVAQGVDRAVLLAWAKKIKERNLLDRSEIVVKARRKHLHQEQGIDRPFNEVIQNRLENPLIIKGKNGTIGCATDEGFNYKEGVNEDAVVVNTEKDGFVMIDGMGGPGKGQAAAQILANAFKEGLEQDMDFATMQQNAYERMRDQGLGKNGACYIAGRVEGDRLDIAQAGDVRLLIIGGDGAIRFSTTDEKLPPPQDNVVTNVVTGNDPGSTTTTSQQIKQGDRILVAPDGIFDNISSEELAQKIHGKSIPEALKIIDDITEQRMKSGAQGTKPDNRSVLIYDITTIDSEKAASVISEGENKAVYGIAPDQSVATARVLKRDRKATIRTITEDPDKSSRRKGITIKRKPKKKLVVPAGVSSEAAESPFYALKEEEGNKTQRRRRSSKGRKKAPVG